MKLQLNDSDHPTNRRLRWNIHPQHIAFQRGTSSNRVTDFSADAHRFAITKHRAKRDKKRGSSILEVIPGLGPKRRRDLLTHFGGIQGVLKASEKDLTLVPGLGEVMARTIYKVLHE